MALLLYLLSLGLAAGTFGVFIQQLLASQGFVPSFRAELLLTGGAAALYLGMQLFYVAFLRVFKPTRASSFYFCESLSQFSALFLLPGVLHLCIPWPHPALAKAEALIYLAAFCALHLFFKLLSFFAALRSEPASRWPALIWALSTGAAGLTAFVVLGQWFSLVEDARGGAIHESVAMSVGSVYAEAVDLPEGAVRLADVKGAAAGEALTFQWAHPADLQDKDALQRAYVTVEMIGAEKQKWTGTLKLAESGWTELRVPAERVPEGLRLCRIRWASEKENPWEKLTGIHPIITSGKRLLLSGPRIRVVRKGNQPLNYIIISMEGLGAEHISGLGYGLATTPGLDEQLMAQGQTFTRAYTPAPESAAASMTLLTGTDPLRHGYLGEHCGPLPPHVRTWAQELRDKHYATVAFVESEGEQGAFAFGSGFESGFDEYDTAYADEPRLTTPHRDERSTEANAPEPSPLVGGSADTVARATQWLDRHSDLQFFMFLRIRELAELKLRERHGVQFVRTNGTPSAQESYDTILAYLDQYVAGLLKHIHDYETRRNTCVVFISPYGMDFSSTDPTSASVGLFESVLNVPVTLRYPGAAREQKNTLLGLEDVMPTALALSGFSPTGLVDGTDIAKRSRVNGPVSLAGEPLVLTVSDVGWRYYWAPGLTPFEPLPTPLPAGTAQLYRAPRSKGGAWSGNIIAQNPNMAKLYQLQLTGYLERMTKARKDKPTASAGKPASTVEQ